MNQHQHHFSELNATDHFLFGAERCINEYILDQMSTKILTLRKTTFIGRLAD